ncbi:hypothetical protein STSP2_03293 [Anaerohalosphaera lusitana]|uniref:Uncharacterized protein n=1 Tax=Anaerohalosphaera lusitana TaxID=1936003 RepID=A0A1U9NQ80_9BACT|nr:hypothetical protein [Anaerohalosphaera lusitana]AQT70091.1 hypothetical protein STSP2_03293 [Anaerohalosphaera lusitana]
MRKVSNKWAKRLSWYCLIPPAMYVLVRLINEEARIYAQDLASTLAGAAFLIGIVWGVYGIACLLSPSWVKCENCAFAELAEDTDKMYCRAKDFQYAIDYSCPKGRIKE